MRRGSILQLVLLGIVFGGIAAAVALAIPWLPPVASKERERIDLVFWLVITICIAIFAIVAAVIAYAAVRFRVKPDDDSDGPPIHGHTGVEIAWTAVPTALVTAIAIVSSVVLVQNGRAGANPLIVDVTAQQFEWSFGYPGGKQSAILVLPLDRKVELHIRAKDVLHSFWVPEFGQKQDAVPGTLQKLVITPNKLGRYPVICTELCGLGHSTMRTFTEVRTPDAFAAWLSGSGQTTPTATTAPPPATTATTATTPTSTQAQGAGNAAAGAAVFKSAGCSSCHTLKAAGATGKVGPDLDKLPADAKKAGQPLAAYILQSIVDPNAYVVPGFPKGVMPPKGGVPLSQSQLNDLVQYLIQASKGGK